MAGFLVELFASHTPAEPRTWLTELDGKRCVVSDRDRAMVFWTLGEARVAANDYLHAHKGQIVNYVIRVQ